MLEKLAELELHSSERRQGLVQARRVIQEL
jgi:hypothetical protein